MSKDTDCRIAAPLDDPLVRLMMQADKLDRHRFSGELRDLAHSVERARGRRNQAASLLPAAAIAAAKLAPIASGACCQ